jgi:serine/threonine protein kinase
MTKEEFDKRYTFNHKKDFIGNGGFGEVYKVYDNTKKRYVALKISKVDKQHKFSLYREVQLANELDFHKHIAKYQNCYRFNFGAFDMDYGVLKYYELGDLENYIRTYHLSLIEKDKLLRGILSGVAFLHQEKIIHRDLKPGNILIDKVKEEIVPKITDFGLSKLGRINDKNNPTKNTSIGKTYAYSAPETFNSNEIYENVDIWAIGVIAYKVFSGKLPFGEDLVGTADYVNNETSAQVQFKKTLDHWHLIPLEYHTFIQKCLIKDPKLRPMTIADIMGYLPNLEKPEIDKLPTKEDIQLDFLNFLHLFETYQNITIEEMLLLEELDLSYKNIKTLPKSIKVMVALTQLELNDNLLSELPIEIGELVNLENFDCSRNKIINLPKSIEKLQKLEYLFLEVNQLSEIPDFSHLPNLECITIYNNNISEEAIKNSKYNFIIEKSDLNEDTFNKEVNEPINQNTGPQKTLKKETIQAETQYNLDENEFEIWSKQDKNITKLKQEASLGNANAQMCLGRYYDVILQDYKEAFKWFYKTAKKGNEVAQYNTAFFYEHGQGVPQDFKKSFYWYQQSANLGFSSSQTQLGKFYIYGVGIVKDFNKAFYWLHKAEKQDDIDALHTLGLMHEDGLGVTKNFKEALKFYNKAKKLGGGEDSDEYIEDIEEKIKTLSDFSINNAVIIGVDISHGAINFCWNDTKDSIDTSDFKNFSYPINSSDFYSCFEKGNNDDIIKFIKSKVQLNSIVLTVPNYFKSIDLIRIEQYFKKNEINIARILTKTQALALSYYSPKKNTEEIVMVLSIETDSINISFFDLGDGVLEELCGIGYKTNDSSKHLILELIGYLLQESELKMEEINTIIIQEESPCFSDFLKSNDVNIITVSHKAIAEGAAVQAGVYAGEIRDILALLVIYNSFSVQINGGKRIRLLEQNTLSPTKDSVTFNVKYPSSDSLYIIEENNFNQSRNNIEDFGLKKSMKKYKPGANVELTIDVDAGRNISFSITEL